MNVTQWMEQLRGEFGEMVATYVLILGLAGMTIALLNCFMGYKLRKIWGCILGLVLGAGAGGGAGYYFLHEIKYAVFAGIIGAVSLAVIAWFFYKMGLFFLCVGLVYGLGISFFQEPSNTTRILCVVAGIFAATLALGYEQWVIIGITGICGGIGGVQALFFITGKETGGVSLVLGLILALLGCFVQAAPLIKEGNLWERKKGKSSRSSLSIPKRRRRKRKKVVYKTKTKEVASSKTEGTKHRGTYAENPTGKAVRSSAEPIKSDQVYKPEKEPVSSPVLPTVVDLDDLSRELSAEVQKIYEEDK